MQDEMNINGLKMERVNIDGQPVRILTYDHIYCNKDDDTECPYLDEDCCELFLNHEEPFIYDLYDSPTATYLNSLPPLQTEWIGVEEICDSCGSSHTNEIPRCRRSEICLKATISKKDEEHLNMEKAMRLHPPNNGDSQQ